MALIVETGAGLADSEAYDTVANALAYYTAYYPTYATTFAALTTTQQETDMRIGAKYIDDAYRGRWKGERSRSTQAMAWPRCGASDEDGTCIDDDEIPKQLKRANYEAAMRARTEDLQPDVSTDRNVQSESKSLGEISKSISYAGVKPLYKKFTVIDRMLLGLLDGFGWTPVERG